MATQACYYACSHAHASYDFVRAQFQQNDQVVDWGERKRLDDLNTIIYEPIQSDDVVIWAAIMIVIIIVNEKDFILNLCKLIIWLWKKLNDLINGTPLLLMQNDCLIALRFIAECNPRSANDGPRLVICHRIVRWKRRRKGWGLMIFLASNQVTILNNV